MTLSLGGPLVEDAKSGHSTERLNATFDFTGASAIAVGAAGAVIGPLSAGQALLIYRIDWKPGSANNALFTLRDGTETTSRVWLTGMSGTTAATAANNEKPDLNILIPPHGLITLAIRNEDGAVALDIKGAITYAIVSLTVPAIRAAGTPVGAAAGGNVTPGLPAGWAANDVHIAVIATQEGANFPTMPGGWTAVSGTPDSVSGAGGTVSISLFSRMAQAGDTAPLVTYAGATGINAVIIGILGCSQSTPVEVVGAVTKDGAAGTEVTCASVTTLTAHDLVLLVVVAAGAVTFGTYTGTPTPIEIVDDDAPGAAGPSLAVAAFAMDAIGATGARTATIAASARAGLQLALRRP